MGAIQMCMHVMLAHMSDEPYWLLRKTFSIQLAVSFLLVVGIVPLVRDPRCRELCHFSCI